MSTCVVLMYHVVDSPQSAQEARLCCPPSSFAAQMRYLHDHGYSVISFDELVGSVREQRSLPSKTVVVTFDDGTSCTYERALPILAEYRFPATVFMVSSLVGRSNEWLQRPQFPQRRMLNTTQLQALGAGGIQVGSHTMTHPWLSRIPLERARLEIRDSKARLEDLLGRSVDYFAYPFGDYSSAVKDAVGEVGYSAACSTHWGKRHSADDLFALHRVEIAGQDSLLQFALKLRFATNNMPPVPEARRLLRGSLERLGLVAPRRAQSY